MAFFDTFSNPFDNMNIFGAKAPSYLGGILDQNELDKLKQQSLVQGLLGTVATYLAQPKNQRYGSALPYLGKAFLGGMQSSQGVYDQAIKDYMMAQQIKEFKDKEAEKKAWETLKPNLYTTTPAVTQEITQAGGYAPQQAEVGAEQVAPNFNLVKQPDVTTQQVVTPAKQELNQAALEKFVLENPRNAEAKAMLENLKTMKEIGAKGKRDTAVVNGVLVDTQTGQAVYGTPERKTITVDGVVLDASTMKPLYKAPDKPESLYKPEVTSEGKVVFIPQKPNLPILDEKGNKVENAGLTTKAPTAEQSNAYIYSNRMESADKILNKLDGKYDPFKISIKTSGTTALVPGGQTLANKMLSATEQQVEQAQRNFINAVLRRESGAVISPSEFENANLQYFPQSGDSPEVKAQKAANRKLAIEDLKRVSGKNYNAPSSSNVINYEDLK